MLAERVPGVRESAKAYLSRHSPQPWYAPRGWEERRTELTDPNPFVLDDDDAETPPAKDNSGSALRKFAKEQQARAKQLETELAELRATVARQNAESIFGKLGVNDRVRKFYQGEPTEEAITQWVKDNADLFGIELGGEDPTKTPEQNQQHQELSAVNQAVNAGQDRPTSLSRETMGQFKNDLLNRQNAGLPDLEEILGKMGVPNTPAQGPMM